MKVLNTSGNSLLAEFNRRLAAAPANQQPSTGCLALFRRMLGHLAPLNKTLGMPAFQMFGLQPFDYLGCQYELDVTWVYPDSANDGVNASFLASVGGTCFQFILFDHLHGTVFERRFPANSAVVAKELVTLAGMTVGYCATARP